MRPTRLSSLPQFGGAYPSNLKNNSDSPSQPGLISNLLTSAGKGKPDHLGKASSDESDQAVSISPSSKPYASAIYTGSKGSKVLSTVLKHHPPLMQDALDEFFSSKKDSDEALKAGEKLDLFLKHGAGPNQLRADRTIHYGFFGRDKRYEAPALTEAIEHDRPDLIDKLLSNKATKVNLPGKEGYTPLDMALHTGNETAFIQLYKQLSPEERIEKTYLPKLKECEGKKYYAYPGSPSVSKDEFESMVPKERRDRFGTPLLVAALRKNPAIFQWLLTQQEAETLISQKDWFGTTPLNAAVQVGQPVATIQALLDKGAKPLEGDIIGYTPLKWAVYGGQPETMECMLKHQDSLTPVSPEDKEAGRKICKNMSDRMNDRSYGHTIYSKFMDEDEKTKGMVIDARRVLIMNTDCRLVIPWLARGVDVNGRSNDGRAIDYVFGRPQFELMLHAAGANVSDVPCHDVAYFEDLLEKAKKRRH